MRILTRKFQEGGTMPAQGGSAHAPHGGGDPLAQIAQLAQKALSENDCQSAIQVCELFMQIMQGAAGGQAPQGDPAPQNAPGGDSPEGEPVFRRGGKLFRVRF